MIKVSLLRVPIFVLVLPLAGCASNPACDYSTLVGSCTASVDPTDTWLFLRAAKCSQVELKVNDRAKVIRTDEGRSRIGSSETSVEIVSCQTYKDLRAP